MVAKQILGLDFLKITDDDGIGSVSTISIFLVEEILYHKK
jgi:hypothetical protein